MKGQELDFLNFLSLRSELNPSLKTIVFTFPGEEGGGSASPLYQPLIIRKARVIVRKYTSKNNNKLYI